uniref:CCHC-type domain-containing protein n=1 Tax=Globodera pallida TaxID=36090 RepID=A0A183CP40_GLOPA
MNLERQEHEQGFVLLVTGFLAFQEAKNYDGEADWEQIIEGVPAEVEPLHSRKVLTQRAEKFALHQFTDCAKEATGLGRIMANLLARQGQQEAPANSWQELLVTHDPVLNELKGGQRETARLMLDPSPRAIFMQAPPGSGKTKSTADIVAAYLRENPGSRALFIAPLNVAVVKAVEEMARTMKRVGWKEEILALFSGSGKKKYTQELEKIGDHLLVSALRAPHLLEGLSKRQSSVVSRYIDACEKSPRTANEGKAARVLLSKEKRRVVFCTMSLAEQIGGMFNGTDVIVVDESGQAPFAQLLATIIKFPKLHKLLITGDRYQLSVHLEDAPEAVRKGLGLDTIIWNLDEAPGVDRTTLTVNFRSHPVLTQCIEAGVYAAHGEVLTAGRRAEEMDRLTVRTPIKLPVKGQPLILIHQTDPMVEDPTSFSASNPEQTRTVIDSLTALRPRFTGSIRIICFYAGQAKELGTAVLDHGLEDVLVSTVDGCQGHEADLVFVVTTKIGLLSMDASGAFWNDERRVNVALSRGKFGMVVVGDLKMLWSAGGIWRRFLKKAMEHTIVVTPDVIEAMTDPRSEFVNGQLVGPNGSVKAENFYDEWGHSGTPGQVPSTSQHPEGTPPMGGRRKWTPSANSRPAGLCHLCKRPGHFIRECPERKGQVAARGHNRGGR